jgi:hypothetical protein
MKGVIDLEDNLEFFIVQSYSDSNLEEAGWGGKRTVLPCAS